MHYVRNFDNPLGGTEQFVKGLIRHLSAYDVMQSIVTNSTDAEAKESHIDTKITVISLPSRTSGAYQILKGLTSVLERNRYDIINIHGYGEFTGDLVCILKKLGRISAPLVLITHGSAGLKHGYLALNLSFALTSKERISRLLHLFYDFTLGRLEMTSFDKVIISSEEEKKYLSKIGLKEKKLTNLPLAINDVFFTPKLCGPGRNYILYVGRIERFKGIDTLMRAIKELRLSNTSTKCILVGADVGYKAKLEILINALRIADIVEIKDQVSQESLVNIYGSAIVTVLASSSEGFPLALVESMASGTPFIATPVGIIPELVDKSKAGMLVPIGNSTELAKSIRKIQEDQTLWFEMSMNGKNFATNFTWDKITRRFYETYLELTEQ
jgi:glycosyltransferase involved in cell wall biosynthesis